MKRTKKGKSSHSRSTGIQEEDQSSQRVPGGPVPLSQEETLVFQLGASVILAIIAVIVLMTLFSN